jgi:hypothetical protein
VQYGGGVLYEATDPRGFRDPQSAQWNVTFERELPAGVTLRLTYAGMNSYRLPQTEDLNQIRPSATPYVPSPYVDPRAPYQNWFVLDSTENAAFSNYQALSVEGNHRMSHGLSFQGNYTWAKNISNAQGDAPGGFTPELLAFTPVADRFDLAALRGNVAGTPRSRFLLTGTYELPFGTGRAFSSGSKIVNETLGGWNVNTITLLQTGQFLTPTISPNADATNTDIAGRGAITLRPDLIGNPNVGSGETIWNINAFVPTPQNAGRVGNAGVGILNGPGLINVSAGLAKTFVVREKMRARFEATFTNVLNHSNFAPPATNISSPSTFGILTTALPVGQGGNRTGQLALRVDF